MRRALVTLACWFLAAAGLFMLLVSISDVGALTGMYFADWKPGTPKWQIVVWSPVMLPIHLGLAAGAVWWTYRLWRDWRRPVPGGYP